MPNPIDVQKALAGASYPSSKADLVDLAKSNGAEQGVVDDIAGLPDGDFGGPDQVEKALF
ncbi:DUF2795 domain-containing protein [Mycolicibacterium sediminis]|uniref:DUF2795 domain-containing protein n=1 Tax=Mycolicibacterium sediminis TaxID=1286180 RepID=A0A7I7QNM6_9MYCO|nr:DUF2795 domain-containing protein [Mycolicibacterium sediminis]BBY27988.1 hypothetical protein MSEDJ_20840 [Mycolicibacterium sediminis]